MLSDETVKEGAKAVQEVAKATGPLAKLADKAGAFVAKVIGGPAEQVGEMLTDRMRLFKYKNLCAVADKVETIHRRRKIEGRTIEIPPRLAIPILEAAAVEDDETLQDIWAGLIANAMDPNAKIVIHPSYLEVARQLTSDEALILSFCPKPGRRLVFEEFQDVGTPEAILKKLQLKRPESLSLYIENLRRLRLLESRGSYVRSNYVTAFGDIFLKACSTKDKK